MLDWNAYDEWNTAIAEVVYSYESAGMPVYLDLDDDALDLIAEHLGLARDDATQSLRTAVRATLRPSGTLTDLFQPHLLRLSRWRRDVRHGAGEPSPPPILPLLAVTVLAAESMGTGSVAANAYFPHLCAELGAASVQERQRVEDSYRRAAETMWDAVDVWLTRIDGRRGLPSAFALAFRFVGLPMSQALVRAGDRAKLVRMFDSFGLPPGYAMAPGDMAGLFDQWVKQQPCPVSTNLANLWSKSATRERIAEVVANELLTWDGSGRRTQGDGPTSVTRSLRLLANVTRGLGKTRLQLTLALRSVSDRAVTVTATAADGATVDLSFLTGPGGLLRLDHLQELDLDSVLSGVLTVSDTDGTDFSRHPRQLIPLSFDEAQAAFVESERVQLAQDAILLVRDMGNRVDEVNALLETIARPGFTRHDTHTTGIPHGWVLFTGVEILGRPSGTKATKFNELVPLASAQLTLAGGMKLPGRIVKWSSLEPPEIRAISQKATSIRVNLEGRSAVDEEETPVKYEFHAPGQALTVATADLDLPDGDYRLSLFEDDDRSPVQQLELRLRSAHTVDAWTWFGAKRLWHDFATEGAWAALSASQAHDEGLDWVIDGPYARGSVDIPSASAVGSEVWWTSERPLGTSTRPVLTVLAPDPRSCVVTGAHFLEYPTWYGPGQKGPKLIEGVCKYCGLVRRSPAWAPRAKVHGSKNTAPVVVNVAALEPVGAPTEQQSWAAALDGVMHLGGGKRVWLERLGLQVNGSQLFVHQFVKAVTALGFIDTARDEFMQLDEWELVPRYLAELADGCFALVGYWPGNSIGEAVGMARDAGGVGIGRDASESIAITVLAGISLGDIDRIADSMDATVVHRTTTAMLEALPSISQVGASLTRIPVPGGRAQERFHLESASWISTDSTAGLGAFRVDAGHGWQYLFRTAEDVTNGTAALGDAYVVKHLAAQQSGRPLLAYMPQRELVVVPVGADLPGLYERATVLSSGRLPNRFEKTGDRMVRLLGYQEISPGDAQRLWDMMSS